MTVGRKLVEIDSNVPVCSIHFVSTTEEGLEKTVRGFNLPFEKEQVKA